MREKERGEERALVDVRVCKGRFTIEKQLSGNPAELFFAADAHTAHTHTDTGCHKETMNIFPRVEANPTNGVSNDT